MKRTPLQRRSPMPRPSKPLPVRKPLPRGCGLNRTGGLKPVSDKRRAENRERTKVLRPIREAQQWCARCGKTGCGLDAHEVVRRSQYRGAITDESVIVLLCRDCHRWVTENPEDAHAAGWTVWSWEYRQGATA